MFVFLLLFLCIPGWDATAAMPAVMLGFGEVWAYFGPPTHPASFLLGLAHLCICGLACGPNFDVHHPLLQAGPGGW